LELINLGLKVMDIEDRVPTHNLLKDLLLSEESDNFNHIYLICINLFIILFFSFTLIGQI